MSETLVIYSLIIAPWLLAGWFRLPRYVAYFQHAGYNLNGYSFLLETGKTENRYLLRLVSAIVTLFFILGCGLTGLGILFVRQPLAMGFVYLGLLVAAIGFLPRKITSERPYIREPRAIRLLVASFGFELLPILIAFWLIWGLLTAIFDPQNSPESMILSFGAIFLVLALGVCAGLFAFALTPYSVIGGHLINRLIERVFRLRSG